MKLSRLAPLQIGAALAAAFLLGCEAPVSSAGEQAPAGPVVVANVEQPPLVVVANQPPATNTLAAPEAAAEAPVAAAQAPDPVPSTNPVISTNVGLEKPAAAPVKLSSRLQEVVKLAQSGVGDDVILAYIQNATQPFNPTPEEIVYLTDLGISDVIITALVNHRAEEGQLAQQATPGPVAPAAPPQPQPFTAPAYNAEPQVVYSEPPTVDYTPAPVVQVAPAPVVEYDSFYDSLAPYGVWVTVPDYGMCWQPTVAVIHHGWRPYCDRGRWVYSDCGWYWHSDYTWGWAPFHYGRWFHHPARGWCWRPDSVWGPAWVAWRYSDAHCGWAPLPPGAHYHAGVGFTYYGASVGVSFGFGLHHDAWTFVPSHRFHEREVWRHALPPGERARAFNHSTVANRYESRGNNIVNHGPGEDHLPASVRSEVRKVAIRDLPERGGAGLKPDQLRQVGTETVVYRPKLPTTSVPRDASRALAARNVRPVASQPATEGSPAVQSSATGGRAEPGRGGREGANPSGTTPTSPGSRPERPVSAGVGTPHVQTSVPSATANPGVSSLASRSEPPPAWTSMTPAGRSGTVSTQPQSAPAARQEVAKPNVSTPSRALSSPTATPQTSRVPSATPATPYWRVPNTLSQQSAPSTTVGSTTASPRPGPNLTTPTVNAPPSWNQLATTPRTPSVQAPMQPAPQTVSPPSAVSRLEVSRPAVGRAPETWSGGPSVQNQVQMPRSEPTPPRRVESPPTYTPIPQASMPSQRTFNTPAPQMNRPMPSYAPPAGRVEAYQSRPSAPAMSVPTPRVVTPSVSAPAMAAPAPRVVQPSNPTPRSAPQSAGSPTPASRGSRQQQ